MSADFALSDLGRVHWGPTIKLALARGFAAGVVWGILMFWVSHANDPAPNQMPAWALLAVPFAWAIIALPLALILRLAGAIIPMVGGWLALVGSLLVCVGDPLVYMLNRAAPHIINVADLSFINFRPMIFVTSPD